MFAGYDTFPPLLVELFLRQGSHGISLLLSRAQRPSGVARELGNGIAILLKTVGETTQHDVLSDARRAGNDDQQFPLIASGTGLALGEASECERQRLNVIAK